MFGFEVISHFLTVPSITSKASLISSSTQVSSRQLFLTTFTLVKHPSLVTPDAK